MFCRSSRSPKQSAQHLRGAAMPLSAIVLKRLDMVLHRELLDVAKAWKMPARVQVSELLHRAGLKNVVVRLSQLFHQRAESFAKLSSRIRWIVLALRDEMINEH